MLMLVAEMISDQERLELIKLINQFLIKKQSQGESSSPTVQDRLKQVQNTKIGALMKNYYASDLNVQSQVTDDDKVMARRAYMAAKSKA